jgi:hypothetical protein
MDVKITYVSITIDWDITVCAISDKGGVITHVKTWSMTSLLTIRM